MDYFTNAIIAAVLWGILILIEANLAKQKIYGPLFLKLLIFGISGLIVFFYYKKNIYEDLNSLWKTNKNGVILFVLALMAGTLFTQLCLYRSFNFSSNRSSIVIAITWGLPLVITTVGSYLFLKEKISFETLLGIMFILLGIYILKVKNT